MASNNSSECIISDFQEGVTYNLWMFTYRVITPIYFLFGILSHGTCLLAFYRQYKKEKAYGYQILTSISDLLEVITVTLCLSTINSLSGFQLPGPLWFKQNYTLMFYAAHLAVPLDETLITVSLLMSLSMAADRVFATGKPFVYKTIKHKRHQAISMTVSVFLAISTSVGEAYRFEVVENENRYEIGVNEEFISLKLAVALAVIRDLIRVIGNLALILCNVAMVICYRLNVNKVGATDGNADRAIRRKNTQKALLLLTVCQSTFVTADITMYNVHYGFVYSNPSFTMCYGKITAAMANLTLQVAGILEFFALLSISKPFRNIIFSLMRCRGNEAISTITGQNGM